jgi:hypothetical protein
VLACKGKESDDSSNRSNSRPGDGVPAVREAQRLCAHGEWRGQHDMLVSRGNIHAPRLGKPRGTNDAAVTRTKVVSPAIDRFRGKAYLLDPFRYNITSTSIDLML